MRRSGYLSIIIVISPYVLCGRKATLNSKSPTYWPPGRPSHRLQRRQLQQLPEEECQLPTNASDDKLSFPGVSLKKLAYTQQQTLFRFSSVRDERWAFHWLVRFLQRRVVSEKLLAGTIFSFCNNSVFTHAFKTTDRGCDLSIVHAALKAQMSRQHRFDGRRHFSDTSHKSINSIHATNKLHELNCPV